MKKLAIASIIAALLSGCVSNPSNPSTVEKPAAFAEPADAIPKNCTLIPPKATNIIGTHYYKVSQSDQSYSEIDPALLAKNELETEPLKWFIQKLNVVSTEYLVNKNSKAGKCVVAYLDEWARTDALLGAMALPGGDVGMPMGRGFQKWILADIGSVYLKVRRLATAEQDERIKWWLNEVAVSVKEFHERSVYTKNNHYAWAGVAVMQAGIITENQTNIEWGRKVFDQQIAEVNPDGSLPKELDRGKQALRYHNFGTAPLLYMAVLSKTIGEDWTTNPKLQKLISFTTEANIDPMILQKLTGKTMVTDSRYGWMGLLPDGDKNRAKMEKYGFPDDNYLGGNLTTMRNLIEQ